MAGGKETPRQKMIGMMYLVLTALLALNVSKSILDAFVSIEENIQKANVVQAQNGDAVASLITSEKALATGEDQKEKLKKLTYVESRIKSIDDETANIIKYIDELKKDILNEASEDIIQFHNNDLASIMWQKQSGVKPIRMNLQAVQGMDKYDEPMHVMGVADDITKPTGKGLELWKKLNNYRSKLVELTTTYQMPGSDKKFGFVPEQYNDYTNYDQLVKKVNQILDKATKDGKLNDKEDKKAIFDIYTRLSKPERSTVHDQEDVHWIGMTFDHAPLVAGIASLSSLQQDILSARKIALDNYASKVSIGEFTFNSIQPLVYGAPVVNEGDSVELKVMMAAFDSENQPRVTVTEGAENAEIKETGKGYSVVKVKAGSSQIDLKGKVAIKNKSGIWKEDDWNQTIMVMKPSGSIELPQMNVLYRGFNNEVLATASGFEETDISVTNASKTRHGQGWYVNPGRGATSDITVIGRSASSGKTATLKKTTFKVRNLPKPTLYWGGKPSGESISTNSGLVVAKYDESITLNVNFEVQSWTFYSPGLNVPKTGNGGNISSILTIARGMRRGQAGTLVCKVKFPNGRVEKVDGTWIR